MGVKGISFSVLQSQQQKTNQDNGKNSRLCGWTDAVGYVKTMSSGKKNAQISTDILTVAMTQRQWCNRDFFQDQNQDFKILSRPRPSLVFKTKTLHLKTKTKTFMWCIPETTDANDASFFTIKYKFYQLISETKITSKK